MSEWERKSQHLSVRSYVPGALAGTATVPLYGGWKWHFFDENSVENEPHGEALTEAEAQEACDAAAVAWVLIALAKRAAAWADSIDAQLAREWRATWCDARDATNAYDAHETPEGREALEAAWRTHDRAEAALYRGYP